MRRAVVCRDRHGVLPCVASHVRYSTARNAAYTERPHSAPCIATPHMAYAAHVFAVMARMDFVQVLLGQVVRYVRRAADASDGANICLRPAAAERCSLALPRGIQQFSLRPGAHDYMKVNMPAAPRRCYLSNPRAAC